MNTVSQTIAKLVILPLSGAAVITGVALGASDSAAAAPAWDPIAPATTSAPAAPAPAAPADSRTSGKQDTGTSDKNDSAKSGKGDSPRR